MMTSKLMAMTTSMRVKPWSLSGRCRRRLLGSGQATGGFRTVAHVDVSARAPGLLEVLLSPLRLCRQFARTAGTLATRPGACNVRAAPVAPRHNHSLAWHALSRPSEQSQYDEVPCSAS